VAYFIFELNNIEIKLTGPKVGAIPIQGSLFSLHALVKPSDDLVYVHIPLFGVAPWKMVQPEKIIEMQIEKCPIHVQ